MNDNNGRYFQTKVMDKVTERTARYTYVCNIREVSMYIAYEYIHIILV